tara:strand:+ start:790 stop:1032 length:243 start_codon:yes stop_codon:yes gene_type:complete
MTNIAVSLLTGISFLVKLFLLGKIKDYIFLLISKVESIVGKNRQSIDNNNDMTNQIFNIIFVFGILYGKIINYVNAITFI